MKVSAEAKEKLEEFLKDYGADGFVRVGRLSSGGGCCTRLTLGVTLDEDKDEESDLSLSIDGLPVVVEKELYESIKEARIVLDPEKGISVLTG